MALTLSLTNTISNITEFTLTDSTGNYSVSNEGGWGSPNIAISDVEYAHLIFTTPTGILYDIDIIDDLGIDFSTATISDLVYTVTNDMIGGVSGEVIPDGVYTVEYQISDSATWDNGGNDYSLTLTIMSYYEVQNSVFGRIGEIPTYYNCGGCDNAYIKETSTLFMLLQSVITASGYSNTELFEIALEALQDIIEFDSTLDEDCGC